MLSPEAIAAIAALRAEPKKPNVIVPERERADWTERARLDPPPADADIRAESHGGVGCETVRAPEAEEDGLVVLLHGGAYQLGAPLTHRKLAYYLSQAARLPVVLPDYRLAPEHPAPAAIDDALAVHAALLAAGQDPARLLLAGDSAGGGLALSLLLTLRAEERPLPAAGFLMSPWTDLLCRGASYKSRLATDPSMNVLRLKSAGRIYAGALDPEDPLISPIAAELGGLPPLLIHVGDDEVMRDDATVLASRAREAGVACEIAIFGGLWHVFHQHVPTLPEARAALAEAGRFLRRHLP